MIVCLVTESGGLLNLGRFQSSDSVKLSTKVKELTNIYIYILSFNTIKYIVILCFKDPIGLASFVATQVLNGSHYVACSAAPGHFDAISQ